MSVKSFVSDTPWLIYPGLSLVGIGGLPLLITNIQVNKRIFMPKGLARLFKYIENFTSKNGKLSEKNSDTCIFHISVQNIDCGYTLEPPQRGGSNEYPQSMFLSRNKKNNVYPVNPSFTI